MPQKTLPAKICLWHTRVTEHKLGWRIFVRNTVHLVALFVLITFSLNAGKAAFEMKTTLSTIKLMLLSEIYKSGVYSW